MANNIETLRKESDNTEVYPNIVTGCIPEGGVTESKIHDEAVTENKIKNGAVTPKKISGQFETDRIEDGAITTIKIRNQAITTDKIYNRAVTSAKLGDLSVETTKIQNDAVTTAKIANRAITVSKISNITQGNTVATQEYVDEHGGGGTALYNHRVRLLMLDSGCSNEGTVYFTIILSTDSPLGVNSFKELFSEEYTDRYDPSDPESEIPYGMQGAYLCPKLHSCYTYYFGVGDEFGKDIELKYFLEGDGFMVGGYGSLTLVSLIDTVTPV